MRIERTGRINPLTPRLVAFMRDALGAVSLDEIQSPQEKRADYACLNGLLAIELKTLEGDPTERIENLAEELRQGDDWPVFLGSAPMESFLKHLDDPEGARRRVTDRIGRTLLNHLKKANKQLAAHANAFPRKNLVRVMLLVNEDHEVYDPQTVVYIVSRALRRQENSAPIYRDIDAVIYMTERHATNRDGRVVFPTVVMTGAASEHDVWKMAVFDRFVHGWADWNNIPLYDAKPSDEFGTIDHIPEKAPRHERWRTDYRRQPYMAKWTKDQLRDAFDETMFISSAAFLKGAPMKPTQNDVMRSMQRFTHIMLEMATRGIPATEFPHETERSIAAARRLGAPPALLDWFEKFERARGRGV